MKFMPALAAALLCAALPAHAADFFYEAGATGQAPVELDQPVTPVAGDFSAVEIMVNLTLRAQQAVAPPAEEGIPEPLGVVRIDEFSGLFELFSYTGVATVVAVGPGELLVPEFVPVTEDGYVYEAEYNNSFTFTDAATIALFQNANVLNTTLIDALIRGNSDLVGRQLDGVAQFSATANYTLTFIPAAVPEPAAWAMMIAGFGLVGGGMRVARRREGMLA